MQYNTILQVRMSKKSILFDIMQQQLIIIWIGATAAEWMQMERSVNEGISVLLTLSFFFHFVASVSTLSKMSKLLALANQRTTRTRLEPALGPV